MLSKNRLFPIVVRLRARYTEIVGAKAEAAIVRSEDWGDMIALLVLRPGQLRDGLNELLCAMPEIGLVAQTDDFEEALSFLGQQCTELVLIKLDASDGRSLGPVREMKRFCPYIRMAAFIEDDKDLPVAEASEADLVLREGVRAPELKAKIRELVGSLADKDILD